MKYSTTMIMIASILLSTLILVIASPSGNAMGNGLLLIRDDETGHEYMAYAAGARPTTPGQCLDDDHGFKPEIFAQATAWNPQTHLTVHVQDSLLPNNFIEEYACGDEITINDQHFNHLLLRLWYPLPS